MTIYTYQNVKLSLEAWHLVNEAMLAQGKSFTEIMELLVRHGAARYKEISKEEWQR